MTTTSPTVAMNSPAAPKSRPASTPTIVAETSWQISTNNKMVLRNFSGDSDSSTSALAPCRPWSRSERARALFMRTSDVSATAKNPERTKSTATVTPR